MGNDSTRERILELLAYHLETVKGRYGVTRLALFGSAARGELQPTSDVDVLVEFAGRPTFDRYMDLKLFLQDILGRPVDLVTPAALRKQLRETIERDCLDVA